MIDPVTSTAPTDDIGAETLDRYRYQARLVAQTCVAMVVDRRIKAVICEWHEDYVVQFANGPSELVSVKHHDGSQNHWSVKQLCHEGGLRHLFERFTKLDECCTCRLQTNEHLRNGAEQPARLRDCCAQKDGVALRGWAEKLAPEFGAGELDQVERFLRRLTIEDRLPDRHVIEPVHLHQIMPRLIHELAITGCTASNLYDRLVALATEASAAPGHEIVLEALADPTHLGRDAAQSRLLAAKTIDLDRVLRTIGHRPDIPTVLLSAATDVAPTRTRLVKKLEAGGVGPTGIRSARRLRSNWEQQESAWSSGLPGDREVIEDLRARLIELARVAEARTRLLTPDLLMGLAYERTEECEIYWSDDFDPDAMP
jgi:hypothetical protein